MHEAMIALLLPLLGAPLPAPTTKVPSGLRPASTEGAWTWTGGSDQVNAFGVYGTRGVPGAGNFPGARHGGVTWRTANGDLWLFGGVGYSAGGSGYLNDLWRWDGAAWTWISGSDVENQPGVYGEQGVASPDNVPGARYAAASSIDSAGNLWLFGGWRYTDVGGTLNDLWKWDGAEWTWVKGSSAFNDLGHWGTLGVPDPANGPRSRRSAASWTDAAGRFWILGGYGAPDRPDQDDLWRWDGTSWTWMAGGGPSLTGLARRGAVSWVDQNDHLWLFGGLRSGNPSPGGSLNDLWRWDGASWKMMGGSPGYDADGVYGARGVAAPASVPGARSGAASWTDGLGNVWLLGGDGHTAKGDGALNDLWRWDGTNWAWIRGSDAPWAAGVYGDPGTPAPGNDPGARSQPSSWVSSSGALRLLGGAGRDSAEGVGELQDFWLYAPPDCTPPQGVLVAPASVLDGSSANGASVSDAGVGATYEWTVSGGTLDSGQGTTSVLFSPAPAATSVVLGITVRKGDCATADERTIPVGVYHALEVIRNGIGNDLVGSTPGDIWCGSTCTAIFAHGAAVDLTAYPGATSRFAGWLGGGCSGTGACVVTMDGPKTISATFFPAAPAKFYGVTPCRVVDTRNPDGPLAGPALAAGASRAFTVGGACGVPADVTAIALNVTVTGATAPGSVTVYPGTGPAPETSTVSFAAARTRANNVTTGVVGGVLSVLDRQETGGVELIVDVSGYYR